MLNDNQRKKQDMFTHCYNKNCTAATPTMTQTKAKAVLLSIQTYSERIPVRPKSAKPIDDNNVSIT